MKPKQFSRLVLVGVFLIESTNIMFSQENYWPQPIRAYRSLVRKFDTNSRTHVFSDTNLRRSLGPINSGHAWISWDAFPPDASLDPDFSTSSVAEVFNRLKYGMNSSGHDRFLKFPQPRATASSFDSVQTAWVREYASQLAPSLDRAVALAIDRSGNTYVTGFGTKLPYGADYVTIKYDPSGRQVWLARYDNGGDDAASAIAVDARGNVYVTGTSERADGSAEFATVKYNADGLQQWVARYSGPGNSTGRAAALALDNSGNVLVSGSSGDSEQSFATVLKYNSDGLQLWIARYSWPENYSNWVSGFAVDSLRNVYVGGGTQSQTGSADYLTLKYRPDGTNLWAARYNGPRDEEDQVSAIAIDASGNVCVTGTSFLSGTDPNWADFSTVKYDSSGKEIWARQFNGPNNSGDIAYAMAVDREGSAYVTGRSDDQRRWGDVLTLKYSPGGTLVWSDRYDGPSSDYDEGRAIILDHSGNVYVTGLSRSNGKLWSSDDYVTIKYSSAGIRQWIARYDGTGNEYDQAAAIALDASGNVYVTGHSEGQKGDVDYATVKYSASGEQQWAARYNGPGNSYDRPTASIVDQSGNVYVTGPSGTGFYNDYNTVKYNKEGVLQWAVQYNGPGDLYDYPTAIKVDQAGNVYVTGESDGSDTRRDYATIKYNSEGARQWVARYNAAGNLPDRAEAIEVDRFGNVYVTGTAFHTSSGTDAEITTIKYDAEGKEQWVVRGPLTFYGIRVRIALDGFGNVYVAGTGRRANTGTDIVTMKYSPAASLLWTAWYNGPANFLEGLEGLSVDASGNAFVTGYSRKRDFYLSVVTIKYDPEGREQWTTHYSASPNSYCWPYGQVVDRQGNTYVLTTDYLQTSSGYASQVTLVKYDPNGRVGWTRTHPVDPARVLAADQIGNVYIAAWNSTSSQNEDLIIKYDRNGTALWTVSQKSTSIAGLSTDFSGNLYVVGSKGGFGWRIVTISKYAGPSDDFANVPTSFLSQSYPNPFNGAVTIRYVVPEPGHVTMKVFNLVGEEVATLVDSPHLAGVHELQWGRRDLASGVYLYRLQIGGIAETRKMVLVR